MTTNSNCYKRRLVAFPLAAQLRGKCSSLSRNYLFVSSYIIPLPLKLGMACLFLIFPESSTWNSECFSRKTLQLLPSNY